MNREGMWKPALIGGLLLGVLSSVFFFVPFLNCCCCLWVVGGGALAAYIHIRESKAIVTLGRGAAIGALAGLIGTGVSTLFGIPAFYLMRGPLTQQVNQALEQARNATPEFKQMVVSAMQQPGMLLLAAIAGISIVLIVNCFLATLGGAIGVAIFEKRPPSYEPYDANSEAPRADDEPKE
jgi:hypothetical protein